MNTIESITALSPANQQEEMAKIIIDKPEFLLVQGVEFLGNHAFQCWIKAESNVQIEIGYGTNFTLCDITTEWQQIQWKFKAETIDDLYMWFPIGTYYVYNTKLERGTTFTDYTESDEDLVKEFESKIEQNADSIKLYVGETYTLKETTTGLEERISKNESSITQTAEEIESLVTRVGETETSVEQTADSITALATRVDGAESNITQNANQIELKVSKGDVSSQISAETGQVSIKSNRFVLESTNCSITKDGIITAKDGNFTGTINSSNATITGGSVNVIGTGISDTKISVKDLDDRLSTAIGPAYIDIDFGSNYSTQLTAGQQIGSVGTCAMIANAGTNLMGLGATGLNFGSTSSSSLKAYYRHNAAYVKGNITSTGTVEGAVVKTTAGVDLDKVGSPIEILLDTTSTGTFQVSKAISNFRYIVLYIYNNDQKYVCGSNFLDTTSFINGFKLYASYWIGGTIFSEAYVQYSSDTYVSTHISGAIQYIGIRGVY